MTSHRNAVPVFATVASFACVFAILTACGGGVAVVGGDGEGAGTGTGTGTGGADAAAKTGKKAPPELAEDGGVKDAARDANDPNCPKTFTEPPGNCTIGLMCSYDQGHCECAGYCGGAPPPPDQDFSHWTCVAKLDNGCPDSRPKSGDACKVPTRSCTYGICCVETFLCGQSGKWSSGGLACPP